MIFPAWRNLRSEPDREAALARYRLLASRYDASTKRIAGIRHAAVDALKLRPGDTVVDVACGTGLVLPALAERVGAAGTVIGIEQSPEMATIARERLSKTEGAARGVILVVPVEEARLSVQADALLFSYTHDVLQNPKALANLFAQAKPGARIAVAGMRALPWWGAPVNAWVLWGARQYLTTWRGLRTPWAPLLHWCPETHVVERYHMGTSYLAIGALAKAAQAADARRARRPMRRTR